MSERLRSTAGTNGSGDQLRTATSLWATLKAIASTSVRIPVPVAAAVLLFFGLSLFFVVHARGQNKQVLQPVAAVETRTVEVPVIQERVVTRVVYVAGNRRPGPAQPQSNRPENLSTAAARFPKATGAGVVGNLSGFKPTDQVKLTIIKGSYHDEK